MVKESSRIKVSGPHIVSEVIEGEAIIIDLNNGNYYSLQDSGAEIWAGVQDGLAVEEIVSRLRAKYQDNNEVIQSAVTVLLEQLQSKALIELDGATSRSRIPAQSAPTAPPERVPFSPPELHTYTDMQDLLMLDPIHEVDASGWPRLPLEDSDSGQ